MFFLSRFKFIASNFSRIESRIRSPTRTRTRNPTRVFMSRAHAVVDVIDKQIT